MKTFEVWQKAREAGGEYILGLKDTGTHACYMIYGVLAPGERERLVKPGKGHEEILLAQVGDIEVTGAHEGTLKEGTAFHIKGEETCMLANNSESEATYVMAGGHSSSSGHGH